MDTKSILRNAISQILRVLFMGVALFWSAGKLDWWEA